MHFFLLHYKLRFKKNKENKWIHTKYNNIPLKVNIVQRVSCFGGGSSAFSAHWKMDSFNIHRLVFSHHNDQNYKCNKPVLNEIMWTVNENIVYGYVLIK